MHIFLKMCKRYFFILFVLKICTFRFANYNLPQKEITYEYNSQLRPENFPFRVVNSFQPVGFDVISPLNLLYGKMNQNLPTRAYWYNVSDATDICAEYTFRYTLTGDYITGMTIEEKINPVNGATAENNTYEYEFIYNFVVEQK